ncbi:MAG: polyamine aminopropyltransferase [Chlamydiota bacterium]
MKKTVERYFVGRFILSTALLFFSSTLSAAEWFQESLFQHWAQSFCIDEKCYEEITEQQDLMIFKNNFFGEILVLDGVIQTTQADEFIYHEMLAHVPLLSHGDVKTVLIVGGGDGGILREVLKHKGVEKVVLVEIDASVIEFSKIHLPFLSCGSFNDARVHVVVQDGSLFVKESSEEFDVIICDSPDPEGPGRVLFTKEFYGDCKKRLSSHGIFVNQSGVPFLQKEELCMVYEGLREHFSDVKFYIAAIPTYIGGHMAFGWATDREIKISKEDLRNRLKSVAGEFKYYTPAVHKAAFALPRYIEQLLNITSLYPTPLIPVADITRVNLQDLKNS